MDAALNFLFVSNFHLSQLTFYEISLQTRVFFANNISSTVLYTYVQQETKKGFVQVKAVNRYMAVFNISKAKGGETLNIFLT